MSGTFWRSRLPQEGVWNLLKRRELKNLCCPNLSYLRSALVRAKERLRHRKPILQSCFLTNRCWNPRYAARLPVVTKESSALSERFASCARVCAPADLSRGPRLPSQAARHEKRTRVVRIAPARISPKNETRGVRLTFLQPPLDYRHECASKDDAWMAGRCREWWLEDQEEEAVQGEEWEGKTQRRLG